jgi:pyruvate/2-oxoglutarate dehydrogenase complex dihydrolipoamide acyltransferase (E2) component
LPPNGGAIATEEIPVKSLILAVILLLPVSTAFAQAPAEEAAPEAAPAPAAAPAKPPVVRAAKPKPKPKPVAPAPARAAALSPSGQEVLDINQIVAIRQVDPATYEIDAVLQNGKQVDLRMNAFVMQDLGRRLGTYGH